METQHRPFSPSRILAITANTLTDLTRQKVFYVLLIFALVLIGSSVFLARFSFQQEFQILKDVSLGAMSIFTSLLAIAATARLIPQDLEDRTVSTILAKPVPRFEYLLGKLLGVVCLLAISLVAMTLLFVMVFHTREQTVLGETMRQMSCATHEQLQDALNTIRANALRRDIFEGVAVIFLKASPARRSDALCFHVRDHEYFYDRGDGRRLFYRPPPDDGARILADARKRRLDRQDLSRHRRADFSRSPSLQSGR